MKHTASSRDTLVNRMKEIPAVLQLIFKLEETNIFFKILKSKQFVCLLDSGLLCLLPLRILKNCTVPKKWEVQQMSILFSSFIFDVSVLWEDDQGLFTGPFGGQGPLLLRSEQL